MTLLAFTDSGDGYYQYDSPDGSAPPWAANLTPCAVQPQAKPIPAQLWTAYQAQALASLAQGDKVAIRCAKSNVPYPADWHATDIALRAIIAAPTGDPTQALPAYPTTYPAGT